VITVCDRARSVCPIFAGHGETLHWGLEDPAEIAGTDDQKLAAFQRTYLEINQRIPPFVEVALQAAGRSGHTIVAG
jgi:arsenate reductase